MKLIAYPPDTLPTKRFYNTIITTGADYFNGLILDTPTFPGLVYLSATAATPTGTGYGYGTYNEAGATTYSIPQNTWLHIVAVDNSGQPGLYINGNPIGTIPVTEPSSSQLYRTLVTFIGAYNFNNGIDGVVDDVALYDRVITKDEVMQLYIGGLPCSPQSPPLVKIRTGCGKDSTSLIASGGTGFRWYDAPAGGNLLSDKNPFNVVVSSGSKDFYVTKVTNGTEGLRVEVKVTANPPSPLLDCNPPLSEGNASFRFSSSGTSSALPFHYTFNFGDGTSVISDSTFIVHQYTSGGDFKTTITLTDSNHCVVSCSQTILIPAAPSVSDIHVCYGTSASLMVTGGTSYRWYDTDGNLLSDSNPFITQPLTDDEIYYVANVAGGTESTRTKVIASVTTNPIIVCSGPSEAFVGHPLIINTKPTSGDGPFLFQAEVNGTPLPQSDSSLTYETSRAGKYNFKVTVTDHYKCQSSCFLSVNIIEPFIPNVITANGDNLNQRFTIFEKTGDRYQSWSSTMDFSLKIISRSGKEVFETADPVNGWAAQNSDSGVYYYDMIVGTIRFKGWVMVVK